MNATPYKLLAKLITPYIKGMIQKAIEKDIDTGSWISRALILMYKLTKGLQQTVAAIAPALLIVAVSGCSSSRDIAASRTGLNPEEEITLFLDSYRAAFYEQDTHLVRSLYVDDGRFIWLEDGKVQYQSPDAILEVLAALPPNMRVETDLLEPVITVLSDRLATVQARFEARFYSPPEEGFSFGGVLSMVLERSASGWRIVSGHTSTSAPGSGR